MRHGNAKLNFRASDFQMSGRGRDNICIYARRFVVHEPDDVSDPFILRKTKHSCACLRRAYIYRLFSDPIVMRFFRSLPVPGRLLFPERGDTRRRFIPPVFTRFVGALSGSNRQRRCRLRRTVQYFVYSVYEFNTRGPSVVKSHGNVYNDFGVHFQAFIPTRLSISRVVVYGAIITFRDERTLFTSFVCKNALINYERPPLFAFGPSSSISRKSIRFFFSRKIIENGRHFVIALHNVIIILYCRRTIERNRRLSFENIISRKIYVVDTPIVYKYITS